MIRNSRKMNDLKNYITELLTLEYYSCDTFNAHVEAGMIMEDKLKKFCKAIHNPEYFKDKLIHISKEEIMSNPYLANIKISQEQMNNIGLSRKRFLPANTVSAYKEKYRDIETFKQINSYYVCDRPLRFPGIVEGNTTISWMTVEPFEINSFQDFINKASGNVLLLGCGLGYLAYMLSLKKEVQKITIVDNNEDIIKLFKNYILCQFENKNKINLVTADALDYLKENNLNTYHHINMDIWRDPSDMILTYLPCLEIERLYPNVSFSYWLENELKEAIQKSILCAVSDFENNLQGKMIKKIGKDLTEETEITNKNLTELIKLNSFRELLYNWYINHKQDFLKLKELEEKEIDDIMKRTRILHKGN